MPGLFSSSSLVRMTRSVLVSSSAITGMTRDSSTSDAFVTSLLGRHELHGPYVGLEVNEELAVLEAPWPTGPKLLQEHIRQRGPSTQRLRAGERPEGDGRAVAQVRALAGVAIGLHGEAAVTLEVKHIGRSVHGPPLAASAEEGARPAPLCAAQAG